MGFFDSEHNLGEFNGLFDEIQKRRKTAFVAAYREALETTVHYIREKKLVVFGRSFADDVEQIRIYGSDAPPAMLGRVLGTVSATFRFAPQSFVQTDGDTMVLVNLIETLRKIPGFDMRALRNRAKSLDIDKIPHQDSNAVARLKRIYQALIDAS